jgi:lambda repressor-like predicted transcriptional regulator
MVGALLAMLLPRLPLPAVHRQLIGSPVPVMLAVARRRTQEQSDRMAAMRCEGYSLARISEETNLSISVVSLELRRRGDVPLRRPASRTRQLSDRLVDLRKRGLPLSQIAEETGLSVSSISSELLRRGVSAPVRRVRRAPDATGGSSGHPLPGLDASLDGRVRELRLRGATVQEIAARLGAPQERVWARLTAMNLTKPV